MPTGVKSFLSSPELSQSGSLLHPTGTVPAKSWSFSVLSPPPASLHPSFPSTPCKALLPGATLTWGSRCSSYIHAVSSPLTFQCSVSSLAVFFALGDLIKAPQ